MNNAFALIHTWPELRNAEYEVVQRIVAGAKRADRMVAVIDNNGLVVWASPEMRLRAGLPLPPHSVDFMISLHFESPRILDKYSYYAVWQPLEFYFEFGYQQSVDRASSHNDALSCESELADRHMLNLLASKGRRPAEPLPKLFHSLPEPFLEPNVAERSRLFYIGINWERIGRSRGRFHETLQLLDAKDMVDIYGPERMFGVAPWEGYKTYRGELPFDGVSVRNAINRSGICLALSSAPHKNAGIMSNRLFEGFGGGAAVIATPNALIDKHFKGLVYLVDDTRGEEVLGQQILEALREIRADPEEARRRVVEAQGVLRRDCSLEGSLNALFDQHPARAAHFEASALADCDMTVVLTVIGETLDRVQECVDDLRRQKRCTIALHLVCDDYLAAELAAVDLAGGAVHRIVVHQGVFFPEADGIDGIRVRPDRTGPLVAAALDAVETPFFALASAKDRFFSDHFASLAKALGGDERAEVAASGLILARCDAHGTITRMLDELRLEDIGVLLTCDGLDQRGRFLFRSGLLKRDHIDLLRLLDDEEHRLFVVAALTAGRPAQSSYASYVLEESASARRFVQIPPKSQQQFIRDAFSGNAEWLSQTAIARPNANSLAPRDEASTLAWETIGSFAPRHLEINRQYSLRAGGDGLELLNGGFGLPEDEHIWLVGDRGVLSFSLARQRKGDDGDFDLLFEMSGRRSRENGRLQHCTIVINSVSVAYFPVAETGEWKRVRIPRSLRLRATTYRVEIIPDHSEVVRDEGGQVVDPRTLSLSFRSLGLTYEAEELPPLLTVGQVYRCVKGSHIADSLYSNFYAPEQELAWITGVSASLLFRLETTPVAPVLVLQVVARPSAEGKRQVVTIEVNGQAIAEEELDDGEQTLHVMLPPESLRLSIVRVDLTLAHADSVLGENGDVVDGRLLGMALMEVGIVEQGSDTAKAPSLAAGPTL